MIRYLWCSCCQSTAVLHSGDICVRCEGEMDALVYPDDRALSPPRRPLGLRLLGWIGRHALG